MAKDLKDTGLKFLTLTFSEYGTRTLTEVFEITPSRPNDINKLQDPDLYGVSIPIKSRDKSLEIKVTVRQGSDDEVFLLRAVNASESGQVVYIDKSGENTIVGTGNKVIVMKEGERTGDREEETVEFTIQSGKFQYNA